MRYADMLNRLKHDWPTVDEPADLDAVLELEPMVHGSERWLRYSDVAKTPDQIDGVFADEYLMKAEPLPKEFVPASFSIKAYNYSHARECRHKDKWPDGVPQVMPDFYQLRNCEYIVSSFAREILEAYAPGCIEYIEVKVDTPSDFIRAPAYYYINVLPRAQLVDWTHFVSSVPPIRGKIFPFKPFGSNDPLIWHEMNIGDVKEQPIRVGQKAILVRGRLWNVLIEHFPLQLRHHMQISKDEMSRRARPFLVWSRTEGPQN
jgi:hypothetical protein